MKVMDKALFRLLSINWTSVIPARTKVNNKESKVSITFRYSVIPTSFLA